jgi:hypothetical protein
MNDIRQYGNAWYESRKANFNEYSSGDLLDGIDVAWNNTDYSYERGRFAAGYAFELMRRFPGMTPNEIRTWIKIGS